MPDRPTGFVPLKSLQSGAPGADDALGTIRRIYFKTSARTIDADFAHAIELLKSLADEATREKASVYMEGLAEMRKEWQRASDTGRPSGRKTAGEQRATESSRAAGSRKGVPRRGPRPPRD